MNEQERVDRVKALAKQHESTKQQDFTKQIIYESLRGRRQLIRVRCVNCLFVIVPYVGTDQATLYSWQKDEVEHLSFNAILWRGKKLILSRPGFKGSNTS